MLRTNGVALALGVLLAALAGAVWVSHDNARKLEGQLAVRLERERALEQRIAEAQAEEDRRLDAIEAARLAELKARQDAEQDRSDADAALTDKEQADQERSAAEQAAELARRAAAEAERRAAEERKKREAEWSRLSNALSKLAPTQRSGWQLTVELPKKFDLERRSRLAGVLLANQGYRVVIEDGGDPAGAEELRQYLIEAGIPPEVLHRAAGKQRRLLAADTILNTPGPPPAEPPLPAATEKVEKAKKVNQVKLPQPAAGERFQIQVASLRNAADAERLAAELRAKKYPVALDSESRAGWTRVLVGPLDSRSAAERIEGRLRSGGYDTWLQRR